MIQDSTILQMHGVGKSFPTPRGPVQVLQSFDLNIESGEFVAITGPSGSGKSTFLNLAALLDQPTEGRVSFEGQDVSSMDEIDLSRIRKERIGMVFQSFCLLPHRSALENVMFRFRYVDTPAGEVAELSRACMEQLGILHLESQPARLLSGGEMQRVAIARAVALRPSLLVADEPTGNLDRASSSAVMEAFQSLNREGITVLMVTHNPALLEYCTRHLDCRNGRLVDP